VRTAMLSINQFHFASILSPLFLIRSLD
jgi:hypothetical protein